MTAVLSIHGKGGSAAESGPWFHTEEQMQFPGDRIREKERQNRA